MAFLPPYPPLAIRGNVFHGMTAAAGVLIPVQSTTSPTFGLFNPSGSGKNANLISIKFGWVSTTGAPANITYTILKSAGSSVATGAPITALTTGTPNNGLFGAGLASVVQFVPATATITTAGTTYATSGISQLTTTGATTSAPMFTAIDKLDGLHNVAPGNFWYVTSSNTAELSVFDICLCWEENPTG